MSYTNPSSRAIRNAFALPYDERSIAERVLTAELDLLVANDTKFENRAGRWGRWASSWPRSWEKRGAEPVTDWLFRMLVELGNEGLTPGNPQRYDPLFYDLALCPFYAPLWTPEQRAALEQRRAAYLAWLEENPAA